MGAVQSAEERAQTYQCSNSWQMEGNMQKLFMKTRLISGNMCPKDLNRCLMCSGSRTPNCPYILLLHISNIFPLINLSEDSKIEFMINLCFQSESLPELSLPYKARRQSHKTPLQVNMGQVLCLIQNLTVQATVQALTIYSHFCPLINEAVIPNPCLKLQDSSLLLIEPVREAIWARGNLE